MAVKSYRAEARARAVAGVTAHLTPLLLVVVRGAAITVVIIIITTTEL